MQSGKVRLTFWLALKPSLLPRFVLRECSRQSVKLFGEWDAYGIKQQQQKKSSQKTSSFLQQGQKYKEGRGR